MDKKRIEKLKDIFIGREKELNTFKDFLKNKKTNSILNIYSNGDGGIGKTKLLEKMMDICQEKNNVWYTKPFIDFYHTETNNRLGVMRRVAESLRNYGEYFKEFIKKLDDYGKLKPENRKNIGKKMSFWFMDAFKKMAESCKEQNKILVLFFDNYEKIQRENKQMAKWFEDMISNRSDELKNVRIVISGRYKLSLDDKKAVIKKILLKNLSEQEMIDYFEEFYSKEEIKEKIGSENYFPIIHKLSEGRPILISLVINWLEYEYDFSLKELIKETLNSDPDKIGEQDLEKINKRQKEKFKSLLVMHIEQLQPDIDRALTHMAFAWRRMNPEIFTSITGLPLYDFIDKADYESLIEEYPHVKNILIEEYPHVKNIIEKYITASDDKQSYLIRNFSDLEKMLQNTESYFLEELKNHLQLGSISLFLKKLRPLSFIKELAASEDEEAAQKVVVLHDEMRDMIDKYWWGSQPNEREEKKKIADALIKYYEKKIEDENISSTEKSNYFVECLYYALYKDIESGVNEYFIPYFEDRLNKFHLNTCELLLNEIERIKESETDALFIEIYRLKLLNTRYEHTKAEALCRDLENYFRSTLAGNPKLNGEFLLQRGIASVWGNQFDKAKKYFEDAEKKFREIKDNISEAKAIRWKGYAIFRSGKFEDAESSYKKSLKKLLKILKDKNVKDNTKNKNIFDNIALLYNNLNSVLRQQGRFYEAVKYGEVALLLREELRQDHEIIRASIDLGDTFRLSNKPFRAMNAFKKAKQIMEQQEIKDELLEARIKTAEAALLYRQADYIYMMEYYVEKDFKDAMEAMRKRLPESKQRYEKAGKLLEKARNRLENRDDLKQSVELAIAYQHLAEYYTIGIELDKALAYYKKSLGIALKIESEYREFIARLGRIFIYYLKDDETEFSGAINNIKKRLEDSIYWDLKGKLELIRGNYSYNQYLKEHNNEKLKDAIERYFKASEYMRKYGKSTLDHFFMTLHLLAKRIAELPFEHIPDDKTLESYREIWNSDYESFLISEEYLDVFEDIIEFAIKRNECKDNENLRKEYIKNIKEKIDEYLKEGKKKARLTPTYSIMVLQMYKDRGIKDEKLCEAHFDLADNFARNDIMFKAHKHYHAALDIIEKNQNLQDTLIHAKVMSRYGKIIYRRGEFDINIEHYRKDEIKEITNFWSKEHKGYIKRSEKYFKKSEEILDNLKKNKKVDKEKINSEKAKLYFRWAELCIMKGETKKKIEKYLNDAIECVKDSNDDDDRWTKMDAIESLIMHYYFSGQWYRDSKKKEIEELKETFGLLYRDKRAHVLKALLDITNGDINYDKIKDKNKDNVDNMKMAFRYYIRAARLATHYSIKKFFQVVSTIIDRISKLPDESIDILHKKVYPDFLYSEIPTGSITEEVFEIVEQYIMLRSRIARSK